MPSRVFLNRPLQEQPRVHEVARAQGVLPMHPLLPGELQVWHGLQVRPQSALEVPCQVREPGLFLLPDERVQRERQQVPEEAC